jgi:AbrB family looped-hinge helix DNA binding protein
MTTLTVTAKGQVTLRKELLSHLGVEPGDRIEVAKLPDGRLQLKAVRTKGSIARAFGVLKREGHPSLSIEEMNQAIADAWAGKR